jgi:DNA-binding phage protein
MNLSEKYTDQQWKLLVTQLKDTAAAKGITQQQIAEATGLHQSNLSRVFSLRYCPTLDMYLRIAGAVGENNNTKT